MAKCADAESLIEAALRAVARDPHHDLAPQVRWALLRAIAGSGRDAGAGVGLRRLVLSESLSTRRVLPAWEQWRPGDRRPHTLLDEAETFIRGGWDAERARAVLSGRAEDYFLNDPPYFVLSAASWTLSTAIFAATRPAELFDDQYPDVRENRELDFPSGWDACYCASVVCAGGASWVPGGNDAARHAFWRWWLTENVPRCLEGIG